MEHTILTQAYDGNPALSMTLCNYPFGPKYVQKCEKALNQLINIIIRRRQLIESESLDKAEQQALDIERSALENITHDDYSRFANIRDRIGRTVLHWCCLHNVETGIVSRLVEKCGASISIEDIDGNKPIDYAVQFNSYECFEYLL